MVAQIALAAGSQSAQERTANRRSLPMRDPLL
jgi:hypothetical protein